MTWSTWPEPTRSSTASSSASQRREPASLPLRRSLRYACAHQLHLVLRVAAQLAAEQVSTSSGGAIAKTRSGPCSRRLTIRSATRRLATSGSAEQARRSPPPRRLSLCRRGELVGEPQPERAEDHARAAASRRRRGGLGSKLAHRAPVEAVGAGRAAPRTAASAGSTARRRAARPRRPAIARASASASVTPSRSATSSARRRAKSRSRWRERTTRRGSMGRNGRAGLGGRQRACLRPSGATQVVGDRIGVAVTPSPCARRTTIETPSPPPEHPSSGTSLRVSSTTSCITDRRAPAQLPDSRRRRPADRTPHARSAGAGLSPNGGWWKSGTGRSEKGSGGLAPGGRARTAPRRRRPYADLSPTPCEDAAAGPCAERPPRPRASWPPLADLDPDRPCRRLPSGVRPQRPERARARRRR